MESVPQIGRLESAVERISLLLLGNQGSETAHIRRACAAGAAIIRRKGHEGAAIMRRKGHEGAVIMRRQGSQRHSGYI